MPENLKADLQRCRADLERQKKECQEQMQQQGQWCQQRLKEKESKITDLTAENANLRQRLLVVDGALNEVPLVQTAKERAVIWVHVTYWLIIAVCMVLLAILLWMHVNLRERVRLYVMRTATIVPSGRG